MRAIVTLQSEKACPKCERVLSSCFYGRDSKNKDRLRSYCRECENSNSRKRMQNSDAKARKAAAAKERMNDPAVRDRRAAYLKDYNKRPGVREARNARMREYRKKPEVKARLKTPEALEKIRIWAKRCRSTDEHRKKQRLYESNRIKQDPVYAVKKRLRCRLYLFLRGRGMRGFSSRKTIGCSFEQLAAHIESQFAAGMTWGNKGLWHIDHIIPLASAKNETEVASLFHYTNLQPLWAKDNRKKGASLCVQ